MRCLTIVRCRAVPPLLFRSRSSSSGGTANATGCSTSARRKLTIFQTSTTASIGRHAYTHCAITPSSVMCACDSNTRLFRVPFPDHNNPTLEQMKMLTRKVLLQPTQHVHTATPDITAPLHSNSPAVCPHHCSHSRTTGIYCHSSIVSWCRRTSGCGSTPKTLSSSIARAERAARGPWWPRSSCTAGRRRTPSRR